MVDHPTIDDLRRARLARRAAEEMQLRIVNGGKLEDTYLSQVNVEPIVWLWEHRVPLGMMTMLCGRKGVMKGLIAMWLAAQVTRRGYTVLWCETEDPVKQILKPRAIAAGADETKFIVKKPSEYAA